MNKFKGTLVLALSLCALSCKKDSNTSDIEVKPAVSKSEIPEEMVPLAKYLSSANGVKFEDITYHQRDSTFIMEGDMVVKQSSVKEEMSHPTISDRKISAVGEKTAPSISQRRHTNLVSINLYTTIRIRNYCTNQNWLLATQQAIRNFNHPSVTAMTKIRMLEVTSGTADITISETGGVNGTAYADGDLPIRKPYPSFDYKPGPAVRIYTTGNNASQREKELVITHELGHTIGFRHTGTTDGSQIGNTPYEDPNSFMNVGGSAGYQRSFLGFTNSDLWAMNQLYPQNTPGNTSVPGTLMSLSGTESFMYGIGNTANADGNYTFYTYNGYNFLDQWDLYYGAGVKRAAINSNGDYYYITADKKIFLKSAYTGQFPVQIPGEAIDIAANTSGEVFIVSNSPITADGNQVMKLNGTTWETYLPYMPRGAIKIALPAGPNAKPFIVDNEGRVFSSDGIYWNRAGVITGALSIAACNSKNDISGLPIIYIISNIETRTQGYGVFRWTGVDWHSGVPGGGISVAVDGLGHPWVVTNTGSIFNNSSF